MAVARHGRAGRQRRRHAARLPQRVRLVPDAARRRADDRRAACSPARRASGASSCAARAARPTTTRSRSRRCRCCAAKAASGVAVGVMDPALVAGLRRFVREPPAAAPAPAGGPRCELCPLSLAEDHKHLLDLEERRIVCVCPTCWSMRSGEARYRPTGSRTLWLEPFELSRRAVGGVPDPDRPRVLPALDVHGGDRRALPEPGRGHRVRARPRGLGPAGRRQPRARGPRPRRRGADRQPAGRPARPRDRAARRLLPARRDHQGDLGGHQRRRGDGGGRRSATSTTCARAALVR